MMLDYSLYYWPIPFRGHFIRYVLAATGTTWDEPGVDEIARMKALTPADQPTPFMGPPILLDHDSGEYMSQMPAIMMHLGRRYRLIGDQDRALRLLCDACDVLQEITRNHGAQMWDRGSWVTFTDTRLPRWMQMHERHVVTGPTAGAPFMSGKDQPGLEDLTLAALWHTMTACLPGLYPLLAANAPRLAGLVTRVAAHEPIAPMLRDWSGRGYCGGQIETSILDMLKKENR